MTKGSKIFVPNRGLGYVSNHIPIQVRYIKKRRMENLIATCVGRSFHTYSIKHFSLVNVSQLHGSDITSMASDTYHIYTSSGNDIFAWRRTVELKHTYKGHKAEVYLMLAFGAHLISIDRSGRLIVWDIKDESIFLELNFNNDVFEVSTILHPSSYLNKILLGSEQGEMQLWNINTSKLIYTFAGWDSAVKCLEQAPAVDVIAVGLENGKIILHNLKFNETIVQFTQDWGRVTSISFRSDRHIMATGSPQGHIVFWDLEEKRVASQLISAHTDSVTSLVCLPSEPLMLTSSPDNTLKLWIFDMTDGGARLLRIREGHSATPTYIRYHGQNGENLLSAAGDSTLRIFNTKTEQFNKSLGRASFNRKVSKKKNRLHDNLVMPPIVAFTSETTREKEWDNIVAIHEGLPHVTTWSYDKMKMGEIKLLPGGLKDNLDVKIIANCICLTHCGNFAVVGYSNGNIQRYNIQSGLSRGKYGTEEEKPHNGEVCGVSTDMLNTIMISGGSDCLIKFWNFKAGSGLLKTMKLEESINFFRSQNESSLLAIALHDFTIVIIDVDTKTIVRKFIGHTSQLTDATFSPNSRWLVTSAMDCTIRTWDIPSSQLVDQFRTENACVSLDFSPTSEFIVTAHVDYLGVFLWANRTIYQHTSLKALNPDDEIPLAALPECVSRKTMEEIEDNVESEEFVSQGQICDELVTLSGEATSRWQNLLNIDVIRLRNKPIAPPKVPKSAPFFLPTIPSLTMKFNLDDHKEESTSKLMDLQSLQNLSEFGKLLDGSAEHDVVVSKLKTFGPAAVDFEIKSLCPEGGGSVKVMLQFLRCIETMLKSNNNFELAQAYLGVFLKSHGNLIAGEEELRKCVPNLQSCLAVSWNRVQEKIMYNLCIVQNLKNQI